MLNGQISFAEHTVYVVFKYCELSRSFKNTTVVDIIKLNKMVNKT